MNAMDVPELFEVETNNKWQDTPLERYYTLNNRAKGEQGENIVQAILESLGYIVEPRKNSGHDRIVNGVKTEIKFSAATDRNYKWQFTFNHIGFKKDWDEIIFCGVNGDLNIQMVKYSKDEIPLEFFNRQQGGESGGNDDFMSFNNKSTQLLRGGTCIINGMEKSNEN